MKIKSMLAALALVFAVGCASTPEEQATQCRYYKGIYEAYLVARQGGNVSEAERVAAQVAAVFLTTYCGYTPPPGPRGPGRTEDENRVPILSPPK